VKKNWKTQQLFIVFLSLFIVSSTISTGLDIPLASSKSDAVQSLEDDTGIDVNYVYNITEALSNIIFTVYDEGEIAKGRAFGTKGEWKAAEILFENMTDLGLYTTCEPLGKRPGEPEDAIVTKLEVLDYDICINDQPVDCFPAPSWKGYKNDVDSLDTTFDVDNLTFIPVPTYPLLYNRALAQKEEPFVFIGRDQWNDPNASLPLYNLVKPVVDPLKSYMVFHVSSLFSIHRQTRFWSNWYPNCKGLVLYDFNQDCHDMIYFAPPFDNQLPTIFINGSLGEAIVNDIDNYEMDLYLKQRYNDSVVSYNVIGQLNGTDPSKIVIVSALYDSWWCQGTADSAIGMGIVIAIAKYFKDHDITPTYTIRFIGFSGEEYDLRGAYYYEAMHRDDDIVTVIDLNQLGFTQTNPRLTLDIVANHPLFLYTMRTIAEQTNYGERTGDTADLRTILWLSGVIPGNAGAFSLNRRRCNSVTFFKDGGWILHHRDGVNHTEGDVLKYFNWTDTQVTGELILNITKYYTMEHEYILGNRLSSFDEYGWFCLFPFMKYLLR